MFSHSTSNSLAETPFRLMGYLLVTWQWTTPCHSFNGTFLSHSTLPGYGFVSKCGTPKIQWSSGPMIICHIYFCHRYKDIQGINIVSTMSSHTHIIWVNYNISLTWIKAIWGWFPLLTMIPGLGRSEVVIIYPDIMLPRKNLITSFNSWDQSPPFPRDCLNSVPFCPARSLEVLVQFALNTSVFLISKHEHSCVLVDL